MKKADCAVLKESLAFMEQNLKPGKKYTSLVSEVAKVADDFLLSRLELEEEFFKAESRITKLRGILRSLTDYDRKSLLRHTNAPGRIPPEKELQVDYVPLMLKQCEETIEYIKFIKTAPEEFFFIRLGKVYVEFTNQPIKFNYGSESVGKGTYSVEFCAAAYFAAGKCASKAAVRNKMRKYICEYVISETPGVPIDSGIFRVLPKYYPNSSKGLKNRCNL